MAYDYLLARIRKDFFLKVERDENKPHLWNAILVSNVTGFRGQVSCATWEAIDKWTRESLPEVYAVNRTHV